MAGIKVIDKEQQKNEDFLRGARLSGQLLSAHPGGPASAAMAQSVVHRMGAIQAQHLEMSHWAVGLRLGMVEGQKTETKTSAGIQAIYQAMETGSIVRTHALRPTWHLLAGEDLLWILELTGPGIRRALFSRDKNLGITAREYVKSDEAIRRILDDRPALTRQALIEELSGLGFTMDEYRSNHYIMHAELGGIICSGPVRDGKHTYAGCENILGKHFAKATRLKETLAGEAAVYELAKRYFSSRGPATIQDFAWWSGLGLTVVKKAITALAPLLASRTADGAAYYYIPAQGSPAAALQLRDADFLLLPAFDEYLISYKDRNHILSSRYASQIITANGLFKPAMLEGGRITGGWQAEKGRKGCTIKLMPFEPLTAAGKKRLQTLAEEAAIAYCAFRNIPLVSLVFA